MNDAQKETIVSLLSEEMAKGKKSNRDFHHLWETLEAFQDMWDNLQWVKEPSNE